MTTNKPSRPEDLRADAESRLRSGTAPITAGWAVGPEALSLLYRLASDPDRSSDALKLLHELQTHQVELNLQHGQLMDSEQELAGQIGHFQSLYDDAPAAYLVLGSDGHILRCNRAASALFGLGSDPLTDHKLIDLLSPDSRPVAAAALDKASDQHGEGAVQVRTLDDRNLLLLSGTSSGKDTVLVLLFARQQAGGS